MFDRRLRFLEGELTRSPENLEAWREVADLVRRTGQLPEWVDATRDLPALLSLWACEPAERDLHLLVLGAAGLELVAAKPEEPGRAWRASGRLGEGDDHFYDLATGLPLRVLVAGTRLELALVPGGAVHHTDRSAWERGGVPQEVEVPSFWIGVHPVRVAEFAEARARDRGLPPPQHWEDQRARPGRPVVFVDWPEAARCAAAFGGRLPTEVEWRCAALGEGRFPWGDDPDPLGRANVRGEDAPWREVREWDRFLVDVAAHPEGASPYGLLDAAGNVWEWSQDWGPPMVDRWLGREAPDPNQGRPRVCLGRSWMERFRGKPGGDWAYATAAPVLRAANRGLRVARDLVPAPEA
jgi:formylglycine-generating enzyme required for sulfatase activity